jgi:hypothetical protein
MQVTSSTATYPQACWNTTMIPRGSRDIQDSTVSRLRTEESNPSLFISGLTFSFLIKKTEMAHNLDRSRKTGCRNSDDLETKSTGERYSRSVKLENPYLMYHMETKVIWHSHRLYQHNTTLPQRLDGRLSEPGTSRKPRRKCRPSRSRRLVEMTGDLSLCTTQRRQHPRPGLCRCPRHVMSLVRQSRVLSRA